MGDTCFSVKSVTQPSGGVNDEGNDRLKGRRLKEKTEEGEGQMAGERAKEGEADKETPRVRKK